MLDVILLLNVIKIQILAGTVVKLQLSFLEDICCYTVCQIKRVCLFGLSRIDIDSTLLRWMEIDSTLILNLCAHWNLMECVCDSRLYKYNFKMD